MSDEVMRHAAVTPRLLVIMPRRRDGLAHAPLRNVTSENNELSSNIFRLRVRNNKQSQDSKHV